MDGLRKLSVDSPNDERQFNPPAIWAASRYTVIEITTFPTRSPLYTSHSIAWNQEEDVPDILATSPATNEGEDAAACMKLLKIPITDLEILQISKQDFTKVITCFDIDPCIRQLLRYNSYGVHQYQSQQGNSYTFYIGTLPFILAWSFNPGTMTTAGILLPRASNGFTDGDATFKEFETILQIYQSHLYSPYLLAFTAGIHISRWLDSWTYSHLEEIRKAENITGHGPFGQLQKLSLDNDVIDLCSRRISRVFVNLANQLRHEDIIGSLITSMSEDGSYKHRCYTQVLFPKLYDEDMRTFRSVLCVMQGQIVSRKSTVSYLHERARSQSTVLFGLLAHADARSSSKLAAAAKNESFSMRIIAVMTMTFLPATFFAALFAVPSLRWDQPGKVIQSNFWVYWAFTVPSTLLIFFLWYLVTHWYPEWLPER